MKDTGIYFDSENLSKPLFLDLHSKTPAPQATVFGMLGKGVHITTFKKEDFKPELAPESAKIEEFEDDVVKFVKMIY